MTRTNDIYLPLNSFRELNNVCIDDFYGHVMMAYYTQFVVALKYAQEREEKNSKMSDGSQSVQQLKKRLRRVKTSTCDSSINLKSFVRMHKFFKLNKL